MWGKVEKPRLRNLEKVQTALRELRLESGGDAALRELLEWPGSGM